MPPSLAVLPEETLLQIAEQVSPDDLKGFALTDRRLHRVAFSRLEEHRNFGKIYSSLDMFFCHSKNPLETILDVCTNARTRYYPNHVDLVGAQDVNIRLAKGNANDQLEEAIQKVAQMTTLMGCGELKGIFDRVDGGRNYPLHGPLLAVCMCLMPNIKAIRLSGRLLYDERRTSVAKFFKRLTKNGYKLDDHQLLGKISTITLVFRQPYVELSRDWLEFIATIPSLTKLKLEGVRSIRINMLSKVLKRKLSSVLELVLKETFIPEAQFADFFLCLGNLKKFEYSDAALLGSDEIAKRGGCKNERILEILRDNAGDTLEALSFDLACAENHEPIETIQSFRNLRIIIIAAQSLQQKIDEPLNLAAILPGNIEELILTTSMPRYPPYSWSVRSRRGPICNLQTFHNLRKLTLTSHLLLQSDGKLLDPADFLPDAIEELTILSPAPLSRITNWREHRQFLLYLQTLQNNCTQSFKKITVGFETGTTSQNFHTDFSKSKPYDSMWEAVNETFTGFERRGSPTLDILLVIEFGPTNSKASTVSDTLTE